MNWNLLKFFQDKKKIPRKRSQAEVTGVRKVANESNWIKFSILIFSSFLLSFIMSGAVFASERLQQVNYDVFVLFVVVLSLQSIIQVYLWLFEREIYASNKKQLLLSVIVLLTIFLQAMLINLPVFVKYPFTKYVYSAPFGIMLLTLFFRIRLSFLFLLLLASTLV